MPYLRSDGVPPGVDREKEYDLWVCPTCGGELVATRPRPLCPDDGASMIRADPLERSRHRMSRAAARLIMQRCPKDVGNFPRTVFRPVPVELFRRFLSDAQFADLIRAHPTHVRVWGFKGLYEEDLKLDELNRDDILVFYEGSAIFAAARVSQAWVSEEAAAELWPRHRGQTYLLMVALSRMKYDLEVPIGAMLRAVGRDRVTSPAFLRLTAHELSAVERLVTGSVVVDAEAP